MARSRKSWFYGKKEAVVQVGDVRGDINVTPLVDVCLVLLIIFMVVTPLLQKGVDVALPLHCLAPQHADPSIVATRNSGVIVRNVKLACVSDNS